MADWYVSSASYAAVAQWAATHAYVIGDLIRPLTAPVFGREYVFRCTVAGTSAATEPGWSGAWSNNQTIVSGTATFTNVAGQSAYGWSAAAGSLLGLSLTGGSARIAVGDRVFLGSDHTDNNVSLSGQSYMSNNLTAAFGVVQYISVNRAGSVPPVAADIQPGATIIYGVGSGSFILDCITDMYWEGIAFNSTVTQATMNFASAGTKAHYFKNCAFKLTSGNANVISNANCCKVTWDNCTVQFSNVGSAIRSTTYPFDFTWIYTPSAIQGATLPTTLFAITGSGTNQITCRGVDLSAITGNLITGGATNSMTKALLDSCKIASGVARFGSSYTNSDDEIELVNCFDGTNTLNERYTAAGNVTTDRSTNLTGGAQDDVGNYSFKLVSSARSDKFAFTLDSFWLDVENTATGSFKTATVEIISPASLNNDDVSLLLEYMGTAGSSVASFASSLPSALTAGSALASSSVTWNNGSASPWWSPTDSVNVIFSNANFLTIAPVSGLATNCGARGVGGISSGKYYWEYTFTGIFSNNVGMGVATASANLTTLNSNYSQTALVTRNGNILINNASTGVTLSPRAVNDVIGVAVDVGAALIWFRVAPSGNWNNSGTANPATGGGGLNISALTGALYPFFIPGFTTNAGDIVTMNSGGSAFTGTAPSGFTSGLPAVAMPKQKLQTTFTPQVAGRVRGLVRLGKPSTQVWVNPQIAIS